MAGGARASEQPHRRREGAVVIQRNANQQLVRARAPIDELDVARRRRRRCVVLVVRRIGVRVAAAAAASGRRVIAQCAQNLGGGARARRHGSRHGKRRGERQRRESSRPIGRLCSSTGGIDIAIQAAINAVAIVQRQKPREIAVHERKAAADTVLPRLRDQLSDLVRAARGPQHLGECGVRVRVGAQTERRQTGVEERERARGLDLDDNGGRDGRGGSCRGGRRGRRGR